MLLVMLMAMMISSSFCSMRYIWPFNDNFSVIHFLHFCGPGSPGPIISSEYYFLYALFLSSNGHFIVTSFFRLSAFGAFVLSVAGAVEGLLDA